MPLFDRKKRKRREQIEQGIAEYFDVLNAYTPTYKTFQGGVYEMELTRAAIHAFANHCSKLKPQVSGTGNRTIERTLQYYPNALMDTKKYLYRLATMTMVNNNAFIAPLYNDYYQKIVGFYPLHPDKVELIKHEGKLWARYEMTSGQYSAIEFDKLGRITQFQNKDEIFGNNNEPMWSTLNLMHTNNQAINEAAKNSSAIKLLAVLGQSLRPEDIDKERERFAKSNLKDNNTGVMLIDTKYKDVKQLNVSQFTVDDKQMQLIRENVYDYFGVSEAILQNKYSSTEWNAFYEGKIEPFALELGLVHTKMLFSDREVEFGNEVTFSANRLQYLSPEEKLSTITQLFDRGFISHNEGLEILNMPAVTGGDRRYIRKEYVDTYNLESEADDSAEEEPTEEPATEEVTTDDTENEPEV